MAYDFTGKRCFVTGAASGIGRATALRLGREGAELFLTDRAADGLESVVEEIKAAGGKVSAYRALDVSDYDAVSAFASDILATHPSMDVLLNIAGISVWGSVDRLSHKQWRSVVDINLMGPIHVIESFVPAMIKARNGGQIVNVSSAAGIVALPWHAAYSASKYGLRGVSEVLRFDLARYKIGVTVVVPGAVNTPLVRTVDIAGVDRENEKVARWIGRFVGHAVSPEKVAERIVYGIRHNRYLVYTSVDIRALYLFKRTLWWPYSVAMRVANYAFTNALRPGFQKAGPSSPSVDS
ncbi:SDR family oxidoreductase [Mycobacteroides immunogenum]|uniref:Short-chain dehydrogenase n=1 Tax=Mycobacteroides immunogenum TaxID=83262 RepID=A0A7V8LNS8_9MYCO|nr:SDR family oxidoreductase [Mycobacteroides immunogenum]AMT71909.1 short-chain dehydrogenase [Mycobacteroides immunogenum]ANO05038.1 short chain dehydrogenase [Mycobacteroides immunogenum]KIU37810.1 short-chain dehydrogenase [Mycobacteroides immunogenum]KPG07078.1 short-chain dehydrogenase [Mycobacteroides immunogenum]KPG07452.1 short-chain dehydrogenase [Mycobacteroides immunogenum]